MKEAFLEISQNSHKNTCARFSFLKKSLWHSCFPVNFVKFLGTPFLTEDLRWLLLVVDSIPVLFEHYFAGVIILQFRVCLSHISREVILGT